MVHLVSTTSPVDAAWAAFDAAAIRLHRMYADGRLGDPDELRAERMALSQEVSRLWDEWRSLYLGTDEPRPAA